MSITTFAEAEQVLASKLPGYTERPQQQALASFIEDIIKNGSHGLAEAGCGTGKSLAALIPSILSGKKVVVATATKALQEQYANKDVPFLEENLGVPFTWALVKGRSNYFCHSKALEAGSKVPSLAAVRAELDANPEHDGDFDHFDVVLTDREKRDLSSTANECPGARACPFGTVCLAQAAKERGKKAQIVITNTAMLLADLKVRELSDGLAAMLGNYDVVLIDEAHETEDYATSALSTEIRATGISMMVGEAENFAGMQGVSLVNGTPVQQALTACWDLLDAGEKKLRFFVEHAEPFMVLIEALDAFGDEVAHMKINRGGEREVNQKARIAKRARNYRDNLSLAVTADDELLVRWIEIEEDKRTRKPMKMFKIAPIHVGSFLEQWLWEQTSAILMSATLSVHGDFSFISDRLGLPGDTESLSVGTPFDYEKQALLFVPPADAPTPKDQGSWLGYTTAVTNELVDAAGGGALLLFTSRKSMINAYENLSPQFEAQGYTCMMQGQDTNKALAERFSTDTHSVLFALKSFMTGVDFQGDTCRLVVIDKLPFPVPTDPIFAARADQVKRLGGNDFSQLTIPLMTLTLEQAYGRLIRTSQDRGVVAILDSRLSSTGYGKRIVNNLPRSPRTTDLATVRSFYKEA